MMASTLYTARWVLPVTSPPIRDAGVLVDERGRIARVASIVDLPASSDVARVELGDAAILPGLINVHAHPELAAFRGLLEDLPFHEWIPTLMRCKRGAQLTPEDYDVAARWTCIESLRAGITAVGATEDSGAAMGALQEAGMRGVVYLETFGPAPAQAEQAMSELRLKLEKHAALASSQVRLGVSPHAPYTVSDALYALVGAFARVEKLPVATHAAEAEAEELLVREALGPFAAGLRSRGIATYPRGRSTIDVLAKTGLLECAPLLIHATRISDDDIRAIADAGASIAHCPVANARLGHGVAPIVEAMSRGVRVAIGTDSVASNNRLDLLEEAHIAQIVQRARLHSSGVLPSAQLLALVTIEAARILGMDSEIGSLEEGKSADLCVIRMSGAHVIPVPEVTSAVFHSARGSDVALTVVAGKRVFENGCVQTLNENELSGRIAVIADRLCSVKAAL